VNPALLVAYVALPRENASSGLKTSSANVSWLCSQINGIKNFKTNAIPALVFVRTNE
jgi:hypothetical protein